MFQQHPGSYKDRSGFVFWYDGKLLRQIDLSYQSHYEALIQSGLYDVLVAKNYLVSHIEIEKNYSGHPNWFKTIQPQPIPFISYPYEWCFTQLQDAALLTLTLMEVALEKGMILKDASPYNIQFVNGKPILIDTLSFEVYENDSPWIAFHQFCMNFLNPLLLAKYGVMDVHKIFTAFPEGILAKDTAVLLPAKAKWNLLNYLHVFLPVKLSKRKPSKQPIRLSTIKLLQLITYLKLHIQKWEKKKQRTTWNGYYTHNNLVDERYLQQKETILTEWAAQLMPCEILDLGCNDGHFSVLFSKFNHTIISCDFDSDCIDQLYKRTKEENLVHIHPVCLDLMHPSTDQGFFNQERKRFFDRIQSELVLMLALLHHLVITNNLSFGFIAQNIAGFAKYLIIEFIPKSDHKLQQLLENKKDQFEEYHEQGFENVFLEYFELEHKQKIESSERSLYFFKNKQL